MKSRILVWEVHSCAQDVLKETMKAQTIQNGGVVSHCKMHGSCCVYRFHQGGEEGYEYMKALVKLTMLMEDGRFAVEKLQVFVDRGDGMVEWDLLDKMVEGLVTELVHFA